MSIGHYKKSGLMLIPDAIFDQNKHIVIFVIYIYVQIYRPLCFSFVIYVASRNITPNIQSTCTRKLREYSKIDIFIQMSDQKDPQIYIPHLLHNFAIHVHR